MEISILNHNKAVFSKPKYPTYVTDMINFKNYEGQKRGDSMTRFILEVGSWLKPYLHFSLERLSLLS